MVLREDMTDERITLVRRTGGSFTLDLMYPLPIRTKKLANPLPGAPTWKGWRGDMHEDDVEAEYGMSAFEVMSLVQQRAKGVRSTHIGPYDVCLDEDGKVMKE